MFIACHQSRTIEPEDVLVVEDCRQLRPPGVSVPVLAPPAHQSELSPEHVGVEDAPGRGPRAGHVGRVRRDEVLEGELGSEAQHGGSYTGGGALHSSS